MVRGQPGDFVRKGRQRCGARAPERQIRERYRVAALPYGEVEPQIKQWPEIMDTFTTSLQEAIVGMKDPEKAISEADQRINAILAR